MKTLEVLKSGIENAKENAAMNVEVMNEVMNDDDMYTSKYKWIMRCTFMTTILIAIGAFMLSNWLGTACKVAITIQVLYVIVFGYLAGYKNYAKVLIKSVL